MNDKMIEELIELLVDYDNDEEVNLQRLSNYLGIMKNTVDMIIRQRY